MIRNVFFVMSLSGSIIAATWYVTYKLFSLELKSKWLRNLLLMSIPFYFIPLPLFKYYMHDLFSFLGLAPTSLIGDIEGSVDKEYMVVNLQSEFLFSLLEKTLRLSMLIIALISFLCIFFRICQYAYLWHLAKQCDPLPLTTPEASLMEALKCELNIAKEVTLIQSPNFTAPFTIGIKHPVVALPTELPQTKQALPMVLKHELIHIKHNDAVSNLIACIILAIHWFNPACYLFLHCFKEAHEIYCDEEVTCSMTKDEKYEYCNLILELSKRSERKWNFFMLSFIGSAKRQIRRRIKRIMKLKDCKFKMAVALGCIMLNLGIGSAFVYANGTHMHLNCEETYSFDSKEDFVLEVKDMEENLIPFADYFTDEEGNVYSANNVSPQSIILCNHEYVKGIRTVHTKIGKGCKIDYYNAKRCIKCGTIISYDLYKTSTWVTCTHKFD